MNTFLRVLNQHLAHWRWQLEFRRRHPEVKEYKTTPAKIRLVLGVGRSGTSWLSTVLSRTKTPIRFFLEPLSRLDPPPKFSMGPDSTAIGYPPNTSEYNKLVWLYCLLTIPHSDWEGLFRAKSLYRNDLDWQFCLVKEVHALLATEILINQLSCQIIFIQRDPVFVIDSLFKAQGLNSPYLRSEYEAVIKEEFLHRFAEDQADLVMSIVNKYNSLVDKRKQMIIEKLLTVTLIQRMFCTLSSEMSLAHVVQYEDLCRSPFDVFSSVAEFLSLEWDDSTEEFLISTISPNSKVEDPYSIFRDTPEQVNRDIAFLTEDEVALCRNIATS